MNTKELFIALFVFAAVIVVFFYKTFFMGQIPFPGDLLVSEYKPWSTYSYLDYVPGSVPNKAQYFDVLRQLYPWRILAMSELKQGNIPLWNPYNFSGSPLLANFQSAVFYPFNIVFFFLPNIPAWGALVIFQPFLALLFTYLFARRIGLSFIGSFFAAISFAFSSFMTVWLEYNTMGHVILWLPLVLLCAESLLKKISVRWSLLFTLSLLASFLAGHPQIFGYLCIFVFAYVAFRLKSLNKKKNIGYLAFFGFLTLLAIGTGGLQLIPGLELIRESARSAHLYEQVMGKILIQPWQLLMFVIPDFFGNPATRNYILSDTYVGKVTSVGIAAFLFFLLALFNKKNPFVRFFLSSSLAVLILVTPNPITAILYKLNIPFFSSSAPTLSVFVLCFSVSLLAGYGVQFLESKSDFVFRRPLFLTIGLFIILWSFILISQKTHTDFWNMYLARSIRPTILATALTGLCVVVLIIAAKRPTLRKSLLIFLILIQCFDIFRSFQKFNPFSPHDFIFPEVPIFSYLQKNAGIDRFWGYGSGTIEANFATAYGLFSPDGYDPLYPRKYGEFIQSSKEGIIANSFTGATRSDATIAPGYGELDLSSNTSRLKVLDLLGVKYILDRVENNSTSKTFPPERFTHLHEDNGWKVFENKNASPRAFLENSQGYVRLLSYKSSSITFSTESSTGSKLFFSDTYYPGWKAYVDNGPVPMYLAHHAFRSVAVPAGRHTVSFQFEPDSFRIGVTTTLVSVGVLLIFMMTIYKRKVLQ